MRLFHLFYLVFTFSLTFVLFYLPFFEFFLQKEKKRRGAHNWLTEKLEKVIPIGSLELKPSVLPMSLNPNVLHFIYRKILYRIKNGTE